MSTSAISGRPDQCAGIIAYDALDQRNTQSFSFGASGAVVRLFSIQIIINLPVVQLTEFHVARDKSRLNAVGPAVKQTQRSIKHDFFSANELQLSGLRSLGSAVCRAGCLPVPLLDPRR